jgi:chorismate--pyruvate lyase
MSIARPQAWRESLLRPADSARAPFNDWLLGRGSLTARIQAKGRFAVRVLRQELGRPTADEALVLGIEPGVQAWVREVALLCDDRIIVFAHTVLPRRPRGPLTVWLARLGNRSLGALLFSHPGFTRGQLAFKRLDHRHALFEPALTALQLDGGEAPTTLWARRSRFGFGEQSVLVSEVFSPRLWQVPGLDKESSTAGERVL